MTRSEQAQKAASEWIEKYGAKGEFQHSLDCIQEVAFEGGVKREQGLKDGILIMYSEYDKKCTELDKYKSACDVMVKALEHIDGKSIWAIPIMRKLAAECLVEAKKLLGQV